MPLLVGHQFRLLQLLPGRRGLILAHVGLISPEVDLPRRDGRGGLLLFVRCPECRTVSRLQKPVGRLRVSDKFCPTCQRVVRIDPRRDEVKFGPVAKSSSQAKPKKKILVADDEESVLNLLGDILTAAGYDVLKARDGDEALVLIYKEHPDLIVLDLMMPTVAGFEVVEEIRRNPRLKKTPILIISGFIFDKGTHDLLRSYGVTEFISKTQMVGSLVSRVQEILSEQAHQVA